MSLLELFDPTGLLKASRKAARKRLRDSVDAHVKPLLRELGFASAQTRAWRASAYREALSGRGWIRIREDAVDLMSIRWEKYGGARFTIDFSSYPIAVWNARRWEDIADFGYLRAGDSSLLKYAWFGRWQDATSAGLPGDAFSSWKRTGGAGPVPSSWKTASTSSRALPRICSPKRGRVGVTLARLVTT